MQHLENEMDDLFQRASENYPLQDGQGDWESIAKRISDKSHPPEVNALPGKKNNKKFILLCLSAFFLLGGWFMFRGPLTGIFSASNRSELVKEMYKKSLTPDIKNNNADILGGNVNNTDPLKKKISNYRRLFKSRGNTSIKATTASSDNYLNKNNFIGSSLEKNPKTIPPTEKADNYSEFYLPRQDSIKKHGKENGEYLKSDNEPTSGQTKISTGVLTNIVKEDAITCKSKKKATTIISNNKGRVYAGLIAGTDFSRVQSRPFNNSGFVAGLLLGYKANVKFSLETGIIWNNKNYNSEGRSFNMDKVRAAMPIGMTINNLESQSSLVEIPIKIRYDFKVNGNSALFAAGGLSAYIMTKEKNRYNVTMNGNQEQMTGSYEQNDYGLPAVANISIGYEHAVSQRLGIRIEPFLKIPLQGIGIGSLPVTSAGLQIGIISKLK